MTLTKRSTKGSELSASEHDNNLDHTNSALFAVAISDVGSALTTGIKVTWYAPYAGTIQSVHACVTTAPTGAGLIFDIHLNGTTIMTTDKLDIDVSENDTLTAGTAPTLTTTSFSAGDKFEFIIDQIGSTIAGAGAVINLMIARN